MLSSDPSPAGSIHELLYRRTPRVVVTPAIVAIDVVLYVAMVVSSRELFFSTATLSAWGGQLADAIGAGQWWRLLTAMFLHGHLPHLLLNMVVLWQLGGIVERLLGPPVFLVVYLLCGVVASVASLYWYGGANVSVGASGAIFGLAGVLLAVMFTASLPWRRSREAFGPATSVADLIGDLRTSVVSFVVYNVAIGFALPQVDVAAHLGGIAGGVVIGLLVGHHALHARPRLVHTVIPAVLTLALAAWDVRALASPRHVRGELARFQLQMDRDVRRFNAALTALAANGRRSPDAAADIERAVLPPFREARARAAALVGTAAAGDDRLRAQAWVDYLAAHEQVWRLRRDALRDGKRELAWEARRLEDAATVRFAGVLRGPRRR